MARSLWNGTVAFAMVRVPVKLYAATESKAVRFHERHASDGAAIRHRRVCVKEDREVPYGEIVKGFEVSPGSYVVLSKEEIAAADGQAARTIAVEHFVPQDEIDPLYYDHAYYLGPGKRGNEPYRVLHAALRRSRRVGIGRFVFHNKAQVVAVRAHEDVIALHAMRFADEIVAPTKLEIKAPQAAPTKRELEMAKALVGQLGSRFQPRRYRDTYREALLQLIERKAQGETVESPEAEPATADDALLDALQESLAGNGGRAPRSRDARHRRPGTGSRPRAAASSAASATKRAAHSAPGQKPETRR
jgi:DNA end-binding protein Ku